MIPIYFLPTGEIDIQRTPPTSLSQANTILAPSISAVQTIFQKPVDMWRLFGWTFVSFYWIFLADFGQTSPTMYSNFTPSPVWTGYPSSSYDSPIRYSSANNIFCNESLFESYQSYLNDTILPFFKDSYGLDVPLPTFKDPLPPVPTTFWRTYLCTEKTPKGKLILGFAVFAVLYPVLAGLYRLMIWIAKCFARPRGDRGFQNAHQLEGTFI